MDESERDVSNQFVINTSVTSSGILKKRSSVMEIMRENIIELGPKGLFTGTKARLAHVVTIVVIQLLVYDYIKQLCGIGITIGAGGH